MPAGGTSDRTVRDPDPIDGPFGPTWRTGALVASGVLAVVILRNMFVAAHQVLGWAVAASLVALLLAPVVRLADRLLPRALAIASTFVLIIVSAGGLTWLYSAGVLDQIELIQERAPQIAANIEDRDDRVGEFAQEVELAVQVTELSDRVAETSGSASDTLRGVALSAPPYFVSMILTIFLLLFGPRMIAGALDQFERERRDDLRAKLDEAARRTQIYVWGSIGQATVAGLAIWLGARILGVPGGALFALFGAVASLVPYLGITVGWLPILLLGLGTSPVTQVAAAAAVAVGMQLGEALWWRRVVDARSLYVGPFVPVVVAIVGFAVYGIGGALYGVVIAVFGLATLDQFVDTDAAIVSPVDDSEFSNDAS